MALTADNITGASPTPAEIGVTCRFVPPSPWPARTTQPSLSITGLNTCSRTGDALQRGRCEGGGACLDKIELCNEGTHLCDQFSAVLSCYGGGVMLSGV